MPQYLGHKDSFLCSTSFYNVGIHRQYVMWERERRRYVATNLTTATLIAILYTASIAAASFRHSLKITFLCCPDMSSTPTPLLKCFRAGRHNIVKISVIEATTFRSYATLSYVSLSTISLNIAHKSLLLWGFVVAMHIHMNGIFWENMLVEWQKQRMYGIRRRFIQQPISHLLISFPLMLEATF